MKKGALTFLFALFLFCFCRADNISAKIFDISEFELKNGLKVVVIPNRKAPIVKQMVWYKVGSIDERLGSSGKAHLLEHLMFRGTKKVRDSEFNRIVDENGGDSNAFTSYDFTAYHQMVDITRLELIMALEADRMENLVISEEALQKEKEIVFQERKQVVENNPTGYFGEVMRSHLWFRHPYGRPVIGTNDEILNFDREEVANFYSKFYAPNNAILVLSGDIDVDTAKILAEKYYGKIKKKEIGTRPNIEDIKKPYSSRLEMPSFEVNAARFLRTYIIPSYNIDKENIYAYLVLASYFGGSENSKLYKDLVIEKKNALSIDASADVFSRGYGTFSLSVVPSNGTDVEKLEKELDKSLKKAISEIDDKEVENVKQKMLAGLIYMKDNPAHAAQIVGSMMTIGMSMEEVENYDEKIKKVTAEDLKAAAKNLSHNLTAVLYPAKEKK